MLDVRPRVREGLVLAPLAHAMIDTSDGLADSTRLLAQASRARLIVDSGAIPWDPALASLRRAAREEAGFFGGDYELLAAIPPRARDRAMQAVTSIGGTLTVVGRVERGRGAYWVGPEGRYRLPAAGWQPFEAGVKCILLRAAPSQRS